MTITDGPDDVPTGGGRRRSPRYTFVASAEVTIEGSSSVIAKRLGDLSVHGCYLCTASLPEGASITIRISAGNSVFQALGRVVYSKPTVGAGVEFRHIEPRYVTVLEEWLLEAKTLTADQLG